MVAPVMLVPSDVTVTVAPNPVPAVAKAAVVPGVGAVWDGEIVNAFAAKKVSPVVVMTVAIRPVPEPPVVGVIAVNVPTEVPPVPPEVLEPTKLVSVAITPDSISLGIVDEDAAVNEPEATLVTNKVSPPFWK